MNVADLLLWLVVEVLVAYLILIPNACCSRFDHPDDRVPR